MMISTLGVGAIPSGFAPQDAGDSYALSRPNTAPSTGGESAARLHESCNPRSLARPLTLDERAAALLTEDARSLMGKLAARLAAIEPWSAEATEAAVRTFAEREGVKLGAVAQPLRAALTGRTTSPGIFEVLALLGKPESLARIADQAAARDDQSRVSFGR